MQLPHSNSLVDRQIVPIGLVNFHLQTPAFILLFSSCHSVPLRTFSYNKEILSKHQINHVFSSWQLFLFLDAKRLVSKNIQLAHHAYPRSPQVRPLRLHQACTQILKRNSTMKNFFQKFSQSRWKRKVTPWTNPVCITPVRDTLSFTPLRAFTAASIYGNGRCGDCESDSRRGCTDWLYWPLRPCALSGRVAVSLAMPFCDSSVCGRHWGWLDDTPITISIRGVLRSQLRSAPPCPPPQTTRSATRTTTPGHCTLTATCPTRCTCIQRCSRITDWPTWGRGLNCQTHVYNKKGENCLFEKNFDLLSSCIYIFFTCIYFYLISYDLSEIAKRGYFRYNKSIKIWLIYIPTRYKLIFSIFTYCQENVKFFLFAWRVIVSVWRGKWILRVDNTIDNTQHFLIEHDPNIATWSLLLLLAYWNETMLISF